MANEDLKNLEELAEQVPDTATLLYTPDKYAAMDPTFKGNWRYLMQGTKKVGFYWTDWKNGVGVLGFEDSEFIDGINKFLLTSKQMKIPAGMAFTAMGKHIEKNAPKGLTVSETESGILSDVLESIFETTENEEASE